MDPIKLSEKLLFPSKFHRYCSLANCPNRFLSAARRPLIFDGIGNDGSVGTCNCSLDMVSKIKFSRHTHLLLLA